MTALRTARRVCRPALAVLALVASLSGWLGAGCTDVDTASAPPFDGFGEGSFDAGLAAPNACGGPSELLLDGAAASPGDACGPCDDGIVLCLGADRLQCIGASVQNVCGGCRDLPDQPGQLCGTCGLGVLACDGTDALECDGDRETNACGGCIVLPAAPGDSCGTPTEPALWICSSPDDLRCVAAGQNACGGRSELDTVPGELCGACGRGFFACAGQDAVVCSDDQAGVNACGGCTRLIGEPGTACGDCGGFYECSSTGELLCNRERNACGGCGALAGVPGDVCGSAGSQWICTVGADVTCAASGQNVCGGSTELDAPAGSPCGECGDGVWTCVDRESTVCLRATERNACGGCGPLAGEPGQACSANAVFVCDGDVAVCESALDINACGGTSRLGASLGTPCGLCDTGRLACAGTETLGCEGAASEESLLWFVDEDEDGFYAEGARSEVQCEIPEAGFSRLPGDCDDQDALRNPDAVEDPCVDAVDLDCNGAVGFVDVDEDGVSVCFDCDDGDATIRPGVAEVCDGVDNNCDGERDEGTLLTFYRDGDGDGFGDPSQTALGCEAPDGYVVSPSDCDDGDAARNPDAVERCDGIDNRCDGVPDPPTAVDARDWFPDGDGDGYGDARGAPFVGCAPPADEGWADNADDCNDADPNISPAASEVCDGVDNNCDRVVDTDAADLVRRWVDADGDGFGDASRLALACPQEAGFADNAGDCDDGRSDTWPGAPERVGDAVDQDCDGEELCYVDADGDGYVGDFSILVSTPDLTCDSAVPCPDGTVSSTGDGLCFLSPGFSASEDCDDTTPLRAPGLPDSIGDGIDSNCDGAEICYRDLDGDGYSPSLDAIVLSSDEDCDDSGEVAALVRETGVDCWDAAFDAASGEGCVDVSGGAAPPVCPNAVHPGTADEATKPIDGVDYDCDASVRCFVDQDEDAFRSTLTTQTTRGTRGPLEGCEVIDRATVYDPGEFDWCDTNDGVRPDLAEVDFDGVDQNCDGVELCYADRDRDGYRADASNADELGEVTCTADGCMRAPYDGETSGLTVSPSPRFDLLCARAQGLADSASELGDCDDRSDTTNPGRGAFDVPDISPSDPLQFDTNCDGIDGDLQWDAYVVCDGTCNGAVVQRAVESCERALALENRPCTVYVGRGTHTFSEPLEVEAPLGTLRIEGGYDSSFTRRRYGRAQDGWTTFGDLSTHATVFEGANPAIVLSGAAATYQLNGLQVEGANGAAGTSASRNGQPSVGIYVSTGSLLEVGRSRVSSGSGGSGYSTSVERGTRSSWQGGSGGRGGAVIANTSNTYTPDEAEDGQDGSGPFGNGGSGGPSGESDHVSVCDGSNCSDLREGRARGDDGTDGEDGACAGFILAPPLWPSAMPDPATWSVSTPEGRWGTSGSGGGGGGGSNWLACRDSNAFGCGSGGFHESEGGDGGDGGDGGGGGFSGAGGGHGGPSIAIAAHDSAAELSEVVLEPGRGGTGGAGQPGSTGGRGSDGEDGLAGTSDPGNGWRLPGYAGGDGGRGGAGGGGGGGAGGHGGASLPVLLSGTGRVVTTSVDITPGRTSTGGSGGRGGSRGANPIGGTCTAPSGPNGLGGASFDVGYDLASGEAL